MVFYKWFKCFKCFTCYKTNPFCSCFICKGSYENTYSNNKCDHRYCINCIFHFNINIVNLKSCDDCHMLILRYNKILHTY